jgi:hypothetical protein
MTTSKRVSGGHLKAFLDELGVAWGDVRSFLIEVPGVVTVEHYVRDKRGNFMRLGDDVLRRTVHADIDWSDPE